MAEGMALISRPRLRGFGSRTEPPSRNLSLLFLVHLRERIRPASPERKGTLMVNRLEASTLGNA